MDTNQGYVTFEDWFNERENFDLRSDRLFNQLQQASLSAREKELLITRWMEAAWQQGQQSMLWQNA